ncbi:cilia- and flagella-associated protein 70-like isoform X2 [Acanthaster planci]|uniref:Cilia- and flagella-associated protein 70-like isoform X2 n=1 Tax=Acanthaster planci TaxID=133434 RepID=A0A8B7ZU30_ACAPL|nr:cilia- and flagella-associated protein 70-like isoform X2 [Acanthaster planci]
MADEELQRHRAPEPVNITVLRARHLRGSKGDGLSSLVKVEYGSNTLGESAKVDSTSEIAAEYNFNAKFDCGFDDPIVLDEIAFKPVLVTVVEVLPKEKKQKEEKTVLLGQCTVDLLPLVHGETKYKSTLIIHPLPGSPLESIPADSPKPEIDIVVSVTEALLSEDQLKESNLLTITVEAAYSVPETWNPTGTQYMYNITLPVPLTNERESTVVLSNGILKAANDKEPPSKQKKWPAPAGAQGGAIFIPDKFVQAVSYDEEDGELACKEDREFRVEAETEKNRVIWNCERRCYMEPSAVQSLQTKIAHTRLWPVELMRMPMPTAAKAKGKEEENPIFFHGVAYVNLAPLLYPGVNKIRGAFRVHAYCETEMMEKTKRKGGLADEAARMATSMYRNASPSIKTSKAGKEEKGGKEKEKEKDTSKKPSQMLKPGQQAPDAMSEVEAPPQQNLEGMQYDEARTYVILEFTLQRSMVPKRAPEELAKRVAEYIPPRPLFPRRTNGAQRAVEDFHKQVASIGTMVLEEFRGMFAGKLENGELPSSRDEQEDRRRKLLYELNSSGKYFAYKEQLKHSVVKIVREKYLKTSAFDNKEELQAFLSDLYIFLVDQMHCGLGKVLSLEDETPVPAPLTDCAQLKHFAREAEVNEDFELAAKYYQERLARNRNDADHWFDYGTFCLLINDVSKAEECFKETVSINSQHLHGLLLYGVVCSTEERNDVAETFFETATCVDQDSVLAWTMLGLFYDGINQDIQAEYAFMQAQKINLANAVAKMKQQQATEQAAGGGDTKMGEEPASEKALSLENQRVRSATSNVLGSKVGSRPGSAEQEEQHKEPPVPVPESSIFMIAAEFLLEVKALQFCERTLAHELLDPRGGPSVAYFVALARFKLQRKEFEEAQDSLNQALLLNYQDANAWSIMGHLRYLQGSMADAKDCYERTLAFVADAREMHAIYLRLASICLQDGEFEKAKNVFLLACKHSPSCISWLGVGIACYRLGELSEAEDALCEANILNNSDPEVWGYLSLVCLHTDRQLEAEQAYKYALKVGLKNEDLLKEIHKTQEQVGFGNPQF